MICLGILPEFDQAIDEIEFVSDLLEDGIVGHDRPLLDDDGYTSDELNVYRCVNEIQIDDSEVEYFTKPPRSILPANPDWQAIADKLGGIPIQRAKATMGASTHHYKREQRMDMKYHRKSNFPAASARRLHETVATDTFFSDTAAIDDGIKGHAGCTSVQIFCGTKSKIAMARPMRKQNGGDGTADFRNAFLEFHPRMGSA